MITFLGLLFAICALLVAYLGLYMIFVEDKNIIGTMFLIFCFGFVGLSCMELAKLPTKRDVLKGKAVYQETIHVTNNDTIKTYEIVWKQKN